MAKVPLTPIGRQRDAFLDDSNFGRNLEAMGAKTGELDQRRAGVHEGWGDKYKDRVHAKGKLTSRERIELLKDEDSEVFEVGTFVNDGREFGKLRLLKRPCSLGSAPRPKMGSR